MRPSKMGIFGLLLAAGAACTQGFEPQNKVDNLRLFAVRADKPYAKPGDTVELEVLMTDARKVRPAPAKLYWIPLLCMNPRDDLYYLCFLPPGDAGAGGGLLPLGDAGSFGSGNGFGNVPAGVDLAPFLPQGPKFSFTMPQDALQARPSGDSYGLAVVFNIACAGKVEIASRDSTLGPQQVPILCTDANGVKLQPNDYVIGISRVYAYATRTNANPVVDRAIENGLDVDLGAGITVPPCKENKRADCPDIKLDVHVTDEAWEVNPDETGRALHEQIWVDWYTTAGEFTDDARLLFDSTKGRTADSFDKFHAPVDPQEGTIWAVVHDNRGGVAWVIIPLHVR